ncbi:hypothetical protein BB558_000837 [Smittium angustum]|uniref:Glutathione synthetase n=1 Tax=Smittium angustum TaxID=133377 RepID=A0A2U1JDB6_SMIAN|nr:hypothetical protein BB558_000837 [Smittium angustum]
MSNKIPQAQIPTDEKQVHELVRLANSYLSAHGVLMKPNPIGDSQVLDTFTAKNPWFPEAIVPAPVAITPGIFYKECFDKAVKLQKIMNKLYDAVSRDEQFIHSVFKEIEGSDEFTRRLYEIYKQTVHHEPKQTISLGIHRSDYLIDTSNNSTDQIKQVEFNTISVSFSSLTAQVGKMHRYFLERTGYKNFLVGENDISFDQLPENDSLTSFADGLASAFKAYGNPNAVVLIVGQHKERNVYDQQWIELQLWERHSIKLTVRSHQELNETGYLGTGTNDNGKLFIDDGQEVAVVYYRSGYTPDDYNSEADWDARLMAEKSMAIKCPTIPYQLVGAKKVQQVLALPGTVEKYIFDKDEQSLIRESFAELYPLDESQDGRKAYKTAMETPINYVLKPQREGGGFNTYGNDIPKVLGNMDIEQQKGYILMSLIKPPLYDSVFLRNGKLELIKSISELGIYGIWLSDNDKVLVNSNGGHLLRSKSFDTSEGGVASGFAVVDSPLLV